MKVSYFKSTDTLWVEFAEGNREESRDLDENTLAEFDQSGNLLSITMEHASERADINSFSFSQEPVAIT